MIRRIKDWFDPISEAEKQAVARKIMDPSKGPGALTILSGREARALDAYHRETRHAVQRAAERGAA